MTEMSAWVQSSGLARTEGSTIAELLVRAAQLTPDRRAVVIGDESLTYRGLHERAREVARGLTALGARRGDHVGILLPNGAEFVEAFFGAAYVGAVVVALNPRYRSHELSYALANSNVVTLLSSGFTDAYTDFPALITACIPELSAAPERSTATEPTSLSLPAYPYLRSVVLLGGEARGGFVDRDRLSRLGDDVAPEVIEDACRSVRPRDVSMIVYTSGTTASPKGCILTHEAVTRGPVTRARGRFRTRDHDVVWSPGPLFHMGSLQWLLGSIGTNGTFVSDAWFDPGRALALIRRERPTIGWPLFPAIMTPILEHPDFGPDAFADLRKMLLIGPEPLLRRVQSTLPEVELVTSCGMTEMAGLYALSGVDEDVGSRASTQGRALPGVRVQIIRTKTGTPVEPGEPGELWVQGPSMMQGYYQDPQATMRAIDGSGWLHTGDLYRQADNENLVFVGRIKDMLKVGGENVSTLEIESFLCGHPDVVEAAVVGVPDDRLDEVPVAHVELRAGISLTATDIVAYCEGRIARYKVPRAVHFVNAGEWPMSTTKIDKTRLRGSVTARMP